MDLAEAGWAEAPQPFRRRDQVAEALDEYERFHWGLRGRRRVARKHVYPRPKTLVELGTLEAIVYGTRKKGDKTVQHYEHEFGETGKPKPILTMDPKNRRLHIVAGGYTVTERGIEG